MNLRPGEAVNWFRIIVELGTQGAVTLRQISRAIDVPKTTIIGWKAGAEPRHSDGERLMALWCGMLHRERIEVPTTSRYSYIS